MAHEGTSKQDDVRLSNLMEEQRNLHIAHEQRITQVEQRVTQVDTRIAVVEVGQRRLETALEKLTDIMSIQATKTTLNEAAIIAIKDGQEQHSRTLEKLTDGQVNLGTIVSELKNTAGLPLGIFKTAGIALTGGIVTALLTHFLK